VRPLKERTDPIPESVRADFLAAAAEREGWATDTAPLFAAMTRSREMAYSFARFALAVLFLLNAAGLFGFPILTQLVGTKFGDHMPLALLSIGAFVIGVTCAAVATLLAFLSLFADSLTIYRHLERIGAGQAAVAAEIVEESKAELAKRLRRDMRLRIRALRFGLLALASFIVGAVFATMVLTAEVPGGPQSFWVHAALPMDSPPPPPAL
jgi:hypothetical protein